MFEIDPKHHDLRADRQCWSTLSLLTLSLVVAALYRIGWLALFYSGQNPNIGVHLGWDRLDFWLRTIATWSKFLAALGLIAITKDFGWRRRGLFLFFCTMVDVALWAIDSTEEVGFLDLDQPIVAWLKAQEWLRYGIGTAVGWSEFILIAAKLSEIGTAYGLTRASEFAGAIRKLTSVGMVLWMLFYLSATRWTGPNPIALKRLTIETYMLWQAVRLIWTICLIRTAVLAVLVLNVVGRVISDEIKRQRRSDDWPESF